MGLFLFLFFQKFSLGEGQIYENVKKPEPSQSPAAVRFEQRIQKQKQANKKENDIFLIGKGHKFFFKTIPVLKW